MLYLFQRNLLISPIHQISSFDSKFLFKYFITVAYINLSIYKTYRNSDVILVKFRNVPLYTVSHSNIHNNPILLFQIIRQQLFSHLILRVGQELGQFSILPIKWQKLVNTNIIPDYLTSPWGEEVYLSIDAILNYRGKQLKNLTVDGRCLWGKMFLNHRSVFFSVL